MKKLDESIKVDNTSILFHFYPLIVWDIVDKYNNIVVPKALDEDIKLRENYNKNVNDYVSERYKNTLKVSSIVEFANNLHNEIINSENDGTDNVKELRQVYLKCVREDNFAFDELYKTIAKRTKNFVKSAYHDENLNMDVDTDIFSDNAVQNYLEDLGTTFFRYLDADEDQYSYKDIANLRRGDSLDFKITRKSVMPVSPYTARINDWDCSLRSGSKLMGIPLIYSDDSYGDSIKSCLVKQNRNDLTRLMYVHFCNPEKIKNGDEYTYSFENIFTNDDEFDDKKLPWNKKLHMGAMYTKADECGLPNYRRFLSDDVYNDISRNINIYMGNRSESECQIRRNHYKRATVQIASMLDYLYDNGYECDFVFNERFNQLDAKIKNSDLSIRLLTPYYQFKYMGNLRENGNFIQFNINMGGRNVNPYFDDWSKNDIKTQDRLNLLKFALGEDFKLEGSDISVGEYSLKNGEYNSYHPMANGTNNKFNANFICKYGEYSKKDSSSGRVYKGDINIYNTNSQLFRPLLKDFVSHDAYFDEKGEYHPGYRPYKDTANDYLNNAVKTAKRRFIRNMNMTYMFDAAQHARGPRNNYSGAFEFFDFSSDNDIRKYQFEIMNYLVGNTNKLKGIDNLLAYSFAESDNNNDNVADKTDINLSTGSDDSLSNEEFNFYNKYNDGENLSPDEREDNVRIYIGALADKYIGSYDFNVKNFKFDPAQVAKYMSGDSSARNAVNIARACDLLGITRDDLLYKKDDAYNKSVVDNFAKFSDERAKSIDTFIEQSEGNIKQFYQNIKNTMVSSFKVNGVKEPENAEIKFDETSGIVSYVVQVPVHSDSATSDTRNGAKNKWSNKHGNRSGGNENKFRGYLGQIFVPDESGVFYTNFEGNKNYASLFGYDATIMKASVDNLNESVVDRTRLIGYEQKLIKTIRYQLRNDINVGAKSWFSENNGYDLDIHGDINYDLIEANDAHNDWKMGTVHNEIGLNSVYRHLTEERFDVMKNNEKLSKKSGDFNDYDLEKLFLEQGMLPDHMQAIFSMLKSRVRYSNDVKENASMFVHYQAMSGLDTGDFDIANDRTGDLFKRCNCKNMAILNDEKQGYFDPLASIGTTVNQGLVRYLVEGAEVDPETGKITPSDDENDRCALFKSTDKFHLSDFQGNNPFDRQNLYINILQHCQKVKENVKVAQINVDGLTQDDAFVVSKQFADANRIVFVDDNGEIQRRSLVIGDKLSDCYGNKGVISKVIDTNLSSDIAEKEGYLNAYNLFKDNPELELIMAPFSAVSRFNAGTGIEMMSKNSAQPLYVKDENGNKKLIESGMGELNIIFTNKRADTSTTIYDRDKIDAGGGRKISAQFGWVLGAKNCKALMHEFYSELSDKQKDMREYLFALGLDYSGDGVITEIDKSFIDDDNKLGSKLEIQELFPSDDIDNDTSFDGGKTQLTWVNGVLYDKNKKGQYRFKDPQLDKNYNKRFASMITNSGGFIEIPFELNLVNSYYKDDDMDKGVTTTINTIPYKKRHIKGNSGESMEIQTYLLPIMSPEVRNLKDFNDGEIRLHDYTDQYKRIMYASMQYLHNLTLETTNKFASKGEIKNKDIKIEQRKERIRKGVHDEFNADDLKTYVYSRELINAKESAQRACSYVVNDIKNHRFSGSIHNKHNMFIENVMSRNVPHSSTSVWAPDANLDIDEIGISKDRLVHYFGKERANKWFDAKRNFDKVINNPNFDEQSEVYKNAKQRFDEANDLKLLVWRDPILHECDTNYMRVKVYDLSTKKLNGVLVNPNVATVFDGDFDGDSVGVYAVQTEEGRLEAEKEFGLHNHIVDNGVRKQSIYDLFDLDDEKDADFIEFLHKKGYSDENLHSPNWQPLRLNSASDIQYGISLNDDLRYKWIELTMEAQDNCVDDLSVTNQRPWYVDYFERVNAFYKKCYEVGSCRDCISYNNSKEHLMSIHNMCVASGVKGNNEKFKMYCDYGGFSGVDVDLKDKFKSPEISDDCLYNIKDNIKKLNLYEQLGVMYATGVKSFGTGVAGAYSQRGCKALRDSGVMTAMLESTYPNTQAILQIKHDPKEAIRKFNLLQTTGKDVWNGICVEYDEADSCWKHKEFEGGREPTLGEWIDSFSNFYNSKNGLGIDINLDYVKNIANGLYPNGELQKLEDVKCSQLDELSYGRNTFDLLIHKVHISGNEGVDLFDGDFSKGMAPDSTKILREANDEYPEELMCNVSCLKKEYRQQLFNNAGMDKYLLHEELNDVIDQIKDNKENIVQLNDDMKYDTYMLSEERTEVKAKIRELESKNKELKNDASKIKEYICNNTKENLNVGHSDFNRKLYSNKKEEKKAELNKEVEELNVVKENEEQNSK